MTPKIFKEQIDNMSYEQLLRHNRFAPAGDPMFVGEVGKYYMKVMAEKRKIVGDREHTAASKSIGWEEK